MNSETSKKKIFWDVYNDDDLEKIDEIIEFINTEFEHLGLMARYDKELLRWKLSDENIHGRGCISYASDGKNILGVVIVTKKRHGLMANLIILVKLETVIQIR